MSSEKGNILELNQYMKSDKMPYIIYADIESLIRKIDRFTNNPENSSATNRWSYSLWGFNINILGIWSHMKRYIMEKKNTKKSEKVLNFFRRIDYQCYQFWKEENVTINKKRVRITQKCDRMLHLWKRILKKVC